MTRFRVTVSTTYEVDSDLTQQELCAVTRADTQKCFGNKKVHVRTEKVRPSQPTKKLARFRPDEVLPFVCHEEIHRPYKVGDTTYEVKMNSHRYFIFRDSVTCAACGLTGTQMVLEIGMGDKSPHFNLYAEEKGQLVLMTKDHVTPKSLGGANHHSNYQTMCAICNNLKGCDNLSLEEIAELRRVYNRNHHKMTRRQFRDLLDRTRLIQSSRKTGGNKNGSVPQQEAASSIIVPSICPKRTAESGSPRSS